MVLSDLGDYGLVSVNPAPEMIRSRNRLVGVKRLPTVTALSPCMTQVIAMHAV